MMVSKVKLCLHKLPTSISSLLYQNFVISGLQKQKFKEIINPWMVKITLFYQNSVISVSTVLNCNMIKAYDLDVENTDFDLQTKRHDKLFMFYITFFNFTELFLSSLSHV